MSCEEIITDGDYGTWEVLKVDNEYEIYNVYPYPIRKRSTGKILKEYVEHNRYLRLCLNKVKYYKHRLIALQWIENPNPDEYTCIDHVNRNPLDNRIENLFWCSDYENLNNQTRTNGRSIEYIDALPDDAIKVDHWNEFKFEDYYFSLEEEKFYRTLRNGNIRIIPTHINCNIRVVKLTDINKHRHKINYSKFLREYDLD